MKKKVYDHLPRRHNSSDGNNVRSTSWHFLHASVKSKEKFASSEISIIINQVERSMRSSMYGIPFYSPLHFFMTIFCDIIFFLRKKIPLWSEINDHVRGIISSLDLNEVLIISCLLNFIDIYPIRVQLIYTCTYMLTFQLLLGFFFCGYL